VVRVAEPRLPRRHAAARSRARKGKYGENRRDADEAPMHWIEGNRSSDGIATRAR
jgi:hypothetical protein